MGLWLLKLFAPRPFQFAEIYRRTSRGKHRVAPERCSAGPASLSQIQAHIATEAVAYAKWLASIEHQRGTYFSEGGQPASLAAWTDPSNDAAAGGFFSGTLATLQSAYVRPRFDGFVRFFESAGIEINRCLRGDLSDRSLIDWLNAQFASRRAAASKA